ANGNVAPAGTSTPDDTAAIERFEALAAEAPDRTSVERSTLGGLPASWSGLLPEPVNLSAAVFDRGLDQRWRRTSYSDIAAGTHDARVASEPEEPVITDEPAAEAPV